MGPADLTQILPASTAQQSDANVLVGPGDDAGIYRLTDEIAIVQTADFITPVVNDPFVYGQIAAANSLSDCFTMNAEVKTALALVMYDSCHVPQDALREILRGGQSKVEECGGVLLGGHTIDDVEMKYGLSVTGVTHPKKYWRNTGARVGDKLILTKPLGMGILTTAGKADFVSKAAIDEAAGYMRRLNLYAMRAAKQYDVSACTDITGFGLLGHGLEMIGCDISFELEWAKIPYLKTALEPASMGIIPAGSLRNRDHAAPYVRFETALKDEEQMVLFDAQTSGGLLIAVRGDQAEQCLDAIRKNGDETARIVGTVRDRGAAQIVVG